MAKRIFDIVFSFFGLIVAGWLLLFCWLLATADTKRNGMFVQKRIGQHAKIFNIYKLRTIHADGKISGIGNFLRNSKLDELPQLWNVLIGDMSFVGPRPDIAGYYDRLSPHFSPILLLKPGITGPASIKYYDEEKLLATQENPKAYNDEIIFPDKLKINLDYWQNRSVWLDIKIIFFTLFRKK